MIEIKNVYKEFIGSKGERTAVLNDISFSVSEGEFLAVLGPSGCGKTTLINIIAGQEVVSNGSVSYGLKTKTNGLSVIWQEDSLIPWLSVESNIEYPLKIKGIPKNERKEKVQTFIKKIGLEGFEKFYPNKISQGMKKRVALAVGLITQPTLLLMDEPFSALDVYTKQQIEDEVIRIWEDIKTTVILVTHDVNEALALSDRILILSKRPASIKAQYDNDLPRPRCINKLLREQEFHNRVQILWNELLNK
jgi:NitT/TauT family transport system ATP-binding protein